MPVIPDQRRVYLSYLHLKEIETVLKDLVAFIDRQVLVENLAAEDSKSFLKNLKKKMVLCTFQLTGDLSFVPEGGGKPAHISEEDSRFIFAFSLDVIILLSVSMLGLSEDVGADYVAREIYDADIQDATNEIFNLAKGGLEKIIRKELEVDVTCQLLETSLVDLNEESIPDLGAEVDVYHQKISIGDTKDGLIVQLIPTILGDFLSSFLDTTVAIEDVQKFIDSSGGISAGTDVKANDKTKVIKRVMVVEDTYLVRQLIAENLRTYGYVVIERSEGISAVKRAILMSGSLDLILLDIRLADVTGFHVLEQLKKHPQTKDIQVIICSALSDKQEVVRGIKLGAIDYIVKPFTRETMLGKVVKAIGRPQK